jgi:predicted Rossmann fold flavoprotein
LISNNIVAIIGAGASGLFTSILLAKKGFRVLVFEKNSKAGRKLLATGNGKCNISNTNLSLEFFHSTNYHFFKYAIETFDSNLFEKQMQSIGLDTKFKGSKIYPKSDQSSSVVDVLFFEAQYLGVEFYFDAFIENIEKKDKFIIDVKDNLYEVDRVIISTGSGAMKKLGSSESGYSLASNFGHTIIKPIPSLVQLESKNESIKKLNGVKTKANVTLLINNQKVSVKEGEILFAKYGVSGNTILDLSKEASIALSEFNAVDILVDIFPNEDKNKLIALLERKQKQIGHKPKEFLLLSLVHSKLIEYIFELARISNDKKNVCDLTKKDLLNLVHIMKNIKIDISSSRGYEYAEVVSGGVDTKDINPKTFESKLCKGLYFTGEVMDVDGDCGGYNLHFAWASAYVLAQGF